ncbi:putative methyltransferase-domain-containing protein [Coniella lustricola]|uniref:Putative methyltransferase-domain-containing protein n=1 Tax=Coniella lustricola TaxID=2025994 RepID=A0A2T3A8S6_9PEZI|nr:putative methyltransferase-domain-containing protein [Coniella lustricola]
MVCDAAPTAGRSESGDPASSHGQTLSHHQGPDPKPSTKEHSIDRFCYQYLQMVSPPEYPPGDLVKSSRVQNEIFERIFAAQSAPPPKMARLQLRALKELVQRIQESVGDDESDEYAVSDEFMHRIGELMSMPRTSELDEAQHKCIVSYRLSLLEPPAMIDILENRSLIAASGTTGLRTWEAGLHLGQYLCMNGHLVRGKRVLELGAGTGYLSVLCAKYLGAAHVTATDGYEEVVDSLSDNLALNNVQWSYDPSPLTSDATVCPKLLKWGHALMGTEEESWNRGQKVHLVLGADITYDQRANPPLVATLRELLHLFPDAKILVAATQRNETTSVVFRELCSQNGLCLEEHAFSLDQIPKHVPDRDVLTPYYTLSMPIHIYYISLAGRPDGPS